MVAAIETSWKYTFRDNIELTLQQKDSMFSGKVMEEGGIVGEGHRPDMKVGTIEAEEVNTRDEPKTGHEIDLEARWIIPRDYDIGPTREYDIDKVRNGIELTGSWVMAFKAARNRKKDALICAAATADALTGKYGAGAADTFDTTNMRVASGSMGMTVAKLREMRRRFKQRRVNLQEEQPYCAMTAVQEDNLLADIQVTSRDFNGGAPTLVDGRITRFLGFEFVPYEDLLTTGGERRCICWVKKGLYFGSWKEWSVDISINKNLRLDPVEAYGTFKENATRLDRKRVGEILCAE